VTTRIASLEPDRLPQLRGIMLLGAPVAAVVAGMAAHWLDFRALREPLLLMLGLGVLATTFALARGQRGWRMFALALAVGMAAWAGEQVVYSVLHVLARDAFDAERFGPQLAQPFGLTAAHALFLGAPTGAVAGILLHLPPLRGVDVSSR
jgi:hypothetical protein